MGRSSKFRVDLMLGSENNEDKLIFYASTREMARLLQQWIGWCLDWKKFITVQYVNSDDVFVQDAGSLRIWEHNNYENWREKMIRRAYSRVDLHVTGAHNCVSDVDLQFYFGSKEDMDVFVIYIKQALIGVSRDINCFVKKNNTWVPWVISTLLREDRSSVLYKLSPENMNRVMEFSKEVLAEQEAQLAATQQE